MHASKLQKLLNVFEAAAVDLKTYSSTQIDSFSVVTELQQSLGIIANYLDLARVELLQQVNTLRADQAQTLVDLKRAQERKAKYKSKLRQHLQAAQQPWSSYISGDSVSQLSRSKEKKRGTVQGRLNFGQPQR